MNDHNEVLFYLEDILDILNKIRAYEVSETISTKLLIIEVTVDSMIKELNGSSIQ